MANNILLYPFLNPVKMVEIDPLEVPQYLTKHFDDYLYEEQIADYDHLEQVSYRQKWQISDTIKWQLESNYAPLVFSLIDADGVIQLTTFLSNILLNKYEPGKYVYQGSMPLDVLTEEGCYFIKGEFGSPVLKTMISEPMSIKTFHKNTILLEYRNNRYHGDVIFETGITFGFRVEGALPPNRFIDGGIRTVYEDQRLNPFIVQAKPWREWPLVIGGQTGVPDWIADRLSWIWSCNDVMIDGKSFAMVVDNFEYIDLENYPMRGIRIKVREGINRGSKILISEGNQDKKLLVVYNIDKALFGDISSNNSNDTIPIKAFE